jgi:hypothetical protein
VIDDRRVRAVAAVAGLLAGAQLAAACTSASVARREPEPGIMSKHASKPAPSAGPTGAPPSVPSLPVPVALPPRFYGVTIDDISHLKRIVASLRGLPARPAVRLVMDRGEAAADYRDAAHALAGAGYLMVEPVDSLELKKYSYPAYVDRFREAMRAFGGDVAVWEIGNEVNGDWTGSPDKVAAKVTAAYELVRAAGGSTALTLSYDPGCASTASNDMWNWADTRLSASVRAGLDYVLVSYYAEDCEGHQPSLDEWTAVFTRLRELFPNARLGFGETGTHEDDPVAYKDAELTRYYQLDVPVAGFVGGYFWWYYVEDMLPTQDNPLYQRLVWLMSQR